MTSPSSFGLRRQMVKSQLICTTRIPLQAQRAPRTSVKLQQRFHSRHSHVCDGSFVYVAAEFYECKYLNFCVRNLIAPVK